MFEVRPRASSPQPPDVGMSRVRTSMSVGEPSVKLQARSPRRRRGLSDDPSSTAARTEDKEVGIRRETGELLARSIQDRAR
jgi:hypothetical protein